MRLPQSGPFNCSTVLPSTSTTHPSLHQPNSHGDNHPFRHCSPSPRNGSTIALQVWRTSLLTAVYVAGYPTRAVVPNPEGAVAVVAKAHAVCDGLHVLEIGCGLGLAGMAAGLRAASVTLADCDDRALERLEDLGLDPKRYTLAHHLWEQDAAILESVQSPAPDDEAAGGPAVVVAVPRIRHWCDAHRIDRIPEMAPGATFDYVIGSDVLYFASQETPLVAVLTLRLRRGGTALLVHAERANNGLQLERVLAGLVAGPFVVCEDSTGPWDWDGMAMSHASAGTEGDGADRGLVGLARMRNEVANGGVGKERIIIIRWRPEFCD